MAQRRTGSVPSVGATANRLRIIRLDFADEDPQVREEYLAEELKRAVAKVPPRGRPEFLERLQAQFPSWDSQVDVTSQPQEPGPRSGVDARELADWSFLVSRLVALWPSLSEGERQAVRDRLVAEGVAGSGPSLVWRDDAAKALPRLLGLRDGDPIDPIRALAVVDLLLEYAIHLDKLAWDTWRDLAPKEKLKDRGALRSSLARFISGDEDVSREQIEQDLARLRRMLASMIHGIKNAPPEWANRHLEEFGVRAIEMMVDIEGVKLLESRDVKCWQKYKQLAEELEPRMIGQDILHVVGEFASRILDSARA